MKVRDIITLVESKGSRGFVEMKRYAVVIEKTSTGYGAYAPDLPGCVAAGDTIEATERLMREAIEFHLKGMRAHGAVPEPTALAQYVEVPAA
jgi:predicted RNase H-like HicB family nuclease